MVTLMLSYEDRAADSYVDRLVEPMLGRYEGFADDLDRLVEESADRAAQPSSAGPRQLRGWADSAARHIRMALQSAEPAVRVRLLRRAASLVSAITQSLTRALAAPRTSSATGRVIRAFIGYLGAERRAIEDATRHYLGIREPRGQPRISDAVHLNRLRETARRIPILAQNALGYPVRGSEGARKPSVRPSAPAAWTGTLNAFGTEIGWPAAGRVRIPAGVVDLGKLRRAGVTAQWAVEQAGVYREVARLNPANPTAAIRAEWLEVVAARLRGMA
ncbi:MAG: hypothetical protein H6R26_1448 [Proteobacteria bacterium]|nr:hypothetical protein [Pseudomonadota bacterium]